MKKDFNSQIWDQIKKHTTIEDVMGWFGVGNVEAFEMLDEPDLYSWFDDMDEARDFLSYVMDHGLSDNDKYGVDINVEKWMG